MIYPIGQRADFHLEAASSNPAAAQQQRSGAAAQFDSVRLSSTQFDEECGEYFCSAADARVLAHVPRQPARARRRAGRAAAAAATAAAAAAAAAAARMRQL